MVEELADPKEPVILPYSITTEVFEYIYKDLQGIEYDNSVLSDKMIGNYIM